MRGLSAISFAALAACASASAEVGPVAFNPNYLGIETRLLDNELVNFRVAMSGARGPEDVSAYARCAAAQYTLIRGYGYLRHVRTTTDSVGNTISADVIYTISPSQPAGNQTIDAEEAVAECDASEIPTV